MKMMMDEKTLDFVRKHANDDTRRLSLQASRWPEVDMKLALQQIAGLQTAQSKLPLWASTDGIIYPPHLSMEQCSSQVTAQYKARLVTGHSLTDLTGGLGVDFSFMAQGMSHATYVERQQHLCDIARHNLPLLGLPDAEVVCGDGIEHLRQMSPVDTIYLDPARRDQAGNRVYALSDCTPDVTAVATVLLEKARTTLIKLSPMLDMRQAIRQLPHVEQVHIVSVRNECKEMLMVMRRDFEGCPTIHCVNDGQRFSFVMGEESSDRATVWNETLPDGGLWLYEPNASLMKAGCHGLLATRMGLQLMSHDSHLMVSDQLIAGFPGRIFRITALSTMNKRELKAAMRGVTHANVAVRNFPMRPPELARRLGVKDGGDCYIFGTTTGSGKHLIILSSPYQS